MASYLTNKENIPSSNLLENKIKPLKTGGVKSSKIRSSSDSKFIAAGASKTKNSSMTVRRALCDVKNVRLNANKKPDSVNHQENELKKTNDLDDIDDVEYCPPDPNPNVNPFDDGLLPDHESVASIFHPKYFDKLFFGETVAPVTEFSTEQLDFGVHDVNLDDLLKDVEAMRDNPANPICDEIYLLQKEFCEMLKNK